MPPPPENDPQPGSVALPPDGSSAELERDRIRHYRALATGSPTDKLAALHIVRIALAALTRTVATLSGVSPHPYQPEPIDANTPPQLRPCARCSMVEDHLVHHFALRLEDPIP